MKILFRRKGGKMGTEKGKWNLGGFVPPEKNNANSRYWPLGWKSGQLDTVGNTTGKVDTLLSKKRRSRK